MLREILNARIVERTQKLNKPEVSKDHIDKSYEEYQIDIYSGGVLFDSEKMSIREMADQILKDIGLT
jgi:cytidylate kinase